jgi:hypothetical protein
MGVTCVINKVDTCHLPYRFLCLKSSLGLRQIILEGMQAADL